MVECHCALSFPVASTDAVFLAMLFLYAISRFQSATTSFLRGTRWR